MHKKLLAVAVAGALAAPLLAQAASSGSTVQIYGVAQFEHAYMDQGAGRPSTDYVESTGSLIGFKGTESLGGGMSAWFQCESTMDVRGIDVVGLCSRNSGLGFRGGFGNVWVGRWHTPMSRALSLGAVGAEATGNLGLSAVTGGTGSTSIMRSSTGYDNFGTTTVTTPTGTASVLSSVQGNNGSSENRTRFRRRETCLTTYESPSMGGFMLGAAVSCGNKAAEASASTQSNDKPRVWSFAGTYINGPLAVGLAYEQHNGMGNFAAGARELDDRGWGLSARYRFGGVTLGGFYLDRKFETLTGDAKSKGGHIGVDWNISGPHALHAAYAWTGDVKGSSTTGIAGTFALAAPGPDTGSQGYTIGYQYSFSKRTAAKLGYTRMDNDSRTSFNKLHTSAPLINNGDSQEAVALVVRHRF